MNEEKMALEAKMTEQQRFTLLKWRARYKRAQLAHSYTATSYGRYHMIFGIVLTILTTSSCILIFWNKGGMEWIPKIVGTVAALFAFLQTFFRFAEKEQIHKDIAAKYGFLKKKVEFIVDFTVKDQLVDDVIELEKVESNIPVIQALHHRWQQAKKETKHDNDSTSIRNRTDLY